jgi:hypothetical protein
MRNRASLLRRVILALVTAGWLTLGSTGAAAGDAAPDEPITAAQIEAAIERVAQDPNLGATKTIRTLRWKDKAERERRAPPGWLEWIGALFGWIASMSRVFVWVSIALLVGVIGLFLARYVRTFGSRRVTAQSPAPTHVRDLDIRPESLPEDIGAAAWECWESGQPRAAMSLLYRGLLSRLVHVHALPIRDSATEGDCLDLVRTHLPERQDFVLRLVQMWGHFVYGGQFPSSSDVRELCDTFACALRPTTEVAS